MVMVMEWGVVVGQGGWCACLPGLQRRGRSVVGTFCAMKAPRVTPATESRRRLVERRYHERRFDYMSSTTARI